jgi:hypothetical protein
VLLDPGADQVEGPGQDRLTRREDAVEAPVAAGEQVQARAHGQVTVLDERLGAGVDAVLVAAGQVAVVEREVDQRGTHRDPGRDANVAAGELLPPCD